MTTNFPQMMPDVAKRIWGDPNQKLSTRTELRWGSGGARKVELKSGTWFDHSQQRGGGVLDLVRAEMNTDNEGAITWLRDNGFDVEDRRQPPREEPRPQVVDTFDYLDENEELAYQVCRIEDGTVNPETGKRNKTFRQRRPDGDGWSWSVKGVQPLLFRLPQVIEAVKEGTAIYICEGEKAVKAAEARGLVATCNSGGAGKWPEEMNEHLRGALVYIIPDNDEAGENHLSFVAGSLRGIAQRVMVVRLPGLPEKGDIADWKGTDQELADLIAAAVEWMPEPPKSRFGAVQYQDIFQGRKSEAEWLIKDTLNASGVCVLAGPPQSGKSFIALEMAMAVAHGTDYNGKRVDRGAVVYQAGEGQRGFHKRVEAYKEENGRNDVPFVLLQEPINLYGDESDVVDFIAEVKAWESYFGEKVKLLVIDTFSAATPGVNENASEHVTTVLSRIQRIQKDCDCTVLILHHMNADGSRVRGHSSLQGNVDNVLICRKLELNDQDGRIIRTVTIDKNKDGEAGSVRRFVLRRVVIGIDEDGDEISSCVVDRPNKGGEEKVGRTRLGPEEVILKNALIEAMEVQPVLAKPEYQTKLKNVTLYRSWQQEALRRWPHTPDPGESQEENSKKLLSEVKRAMTRFGKRMRAAGHLGVYNEEKRSVVWWASDGLGAVGSQPKPEPQRKEPEDELPF